MRGACSFARLAFRHGIAAPSRNHANIPTHFCYNRRKAFTICEPIFLPSTMQFPTTALVVLLLAHSLLVSVESFSQNKYLHHGGLTASSSTTSLYFGLPSWFTTPESTDGSSSSSKEEVPEKKIGVAGVLQLITAGMGAPFLGEFEGVDEETGRFMFSLEANNLVDENGNSKQTSMPYFESGWVDPEDEKRASEGFKLPWQK